MEKQSGGDDLAHFLAIPWCANTLAQDTWQTAPVISRTAKPDTEDELLGATLNSAHTVSHMLFAWQPPKAGASLGTTHGYATLAAGVNGFAHVCHGGVVATLIDEFMGITTTANKRREAELAVQRGELTAQEGAKLVPSLTAELTVRYRRPVATPQTVLFRTTVRERNGRKMWLESEVVDARGELLATGKSLFVQVAASKKMPTAKM